MIWYTWMNVYLNQINQSFLYDQWFCKCLLCIWLSQCIIYVFCHLPYCIEYCIHCMWLLLQVPAISGAKYYFLLFCYFLLCCYRHSGFLLSMYNLNQISQDFCLCYQWFCECIIHVLLCLIYCLVNSSGCAPIVAPDFIIVFVRRSIVALSYLKIRNHILLI